MGMTSGGDRVLLKGYSHEIEPENGSIGKADGSIDFNDSLGNISVGGADAVLSPLPFMIVGCTNGGDAIGGGGGSVEARRHGVKNGTLTLRDGDTGTCQGFLTSPTAGVLPCRCKVTAKSSAIGGAGASIVAIPAVDAATASSGSAAHAHGKSAKSRPRHPKFTVQNSNGSSAPNVSVCFRGSGGAQGSLVTDGYGVINLERLGFVPHSATIAENPAKWTPYPARANSLECEQFLLDPFLYNFYRRTRGEFDLARPLPSRTIGSVLFAQVSGLGSWIGGSLMGEFNENPSSGQIVLDMVVTMIPVVDQIGDARDLMAIILRMREDSERERFLNWLSLSSCLIGLIPELGSALRAAARLIIRDVLRAGGEIAKVTRHTADAVFAAIRSLGFGDPKAFLQSINWGRVASEVVAAYRELGRRATTVIDYLLTIAKGATREFLTALRKQFEIAGADRQLRAAVQWLEKQMPVWLKNSLEKRPTSIFPNVKDANEVVLDGGDKIARLEGRFDGDLFSLKRTTPAVARYLDAAGWRATTHRMLGNRFGKPLVFKLAGFPEETFKLWSAPSGHLFGTYDELNKLRAAARRKLQGTDIIHIEDKAFTNARDDRAIREIYAKLNKYEHHHIVEMQDLKLVGAFDENIVFGAKDQTSKLLRNRYDQLPCVMVPKDYHATITSELKSARKDIGGMTIDDVVEEYSTVHRNLLNKPIADDVDSVVADLVDAIRNQYIGN
ncbi:hypothetical protein M2212_006223 [Bradyrhizobium elkanii]|uniref:hypothetical protein n=1 Tax=Bradyrhizobium elkanii TaxID=29448 RepID=UPI00216A303D|nr:hypothetical protein [Bradyrhizobium elkanii]MCS3479377.1 hypothetical protein [Bradyrhizobium elkanii]